MYYVEKYFKQHRINFAAFSNCLLSFSWTHEFLLLLDCTGPILDVKCQLTMGFCLDGWSTAFLSNRNLRAHRVLSAGGFGFLIVVTQPSRYKGRSRNMNLRVKGAPQPGPYPSTPLVCGPERKKAPEEKAGPSPWSAESSSLGSASPSAASLWSILEHILKHAVWGSYRIYEVVGFFHPSRELAMGNKKF